MMTDLTATFDEARKVAKSYFNFAVKYVNVVQMRAVYGNPDGWGFIETPTSFTIEADTWRLHVGLDSSRANWIVQCRGEWEDVLWHYNRLADASDAWNSEGMQDAVKKDLDRWLHQQPQTRKPYPEGSSRTTRPKISPDQTVVEDASTSTLTQGQAPTFGTSQYASKSRPRKTKR